MLDHCHSDVISTMINIVFVLKEIGPVYGFQDMLVFSFFYMYIII